MNRQDISDNLRFRSQARKTWRIRVLPGWSAINATYGQRNPNTGLRQANSQKGSFEAIDIGLGAKGQGSYIPATIVNKSVAFVDYL